MVSKGALSQVRDQFARFQKAKPKWSNPEASIGKFCGKKGKYSCWEAEGIAQEAFKEMGLDISALLNRTCGPVPASSQVIYDMFMVGENPETAVPQIMFSCRKPSPRKAAVEILKKSGILNKYPGVETGHWQFPPHIMDPRLLASNGGETPMTPTAGSKALLIPLYASATILSSPASSKTVLAMQVYTESPYGYHPSLTATAGSRVCYAGKNFYISVAHAFIPESSLNTEDNDDDSEFEFGGMSDEDEEFDNEELEITSSGSMTSESSGPDSSSSNDDITINGGTESLSVALSDISTKESPDSTHSGTSDNFRIGSQLFSRKQGPLDAAVANVFLASTDLDYALVEARNEDGLISASDDLPLLSLGNVQKISPGEARVIAVTGSSGPLFGVLSGRPSYIRLPSSMNFQETYTVALDGPLNPGDSGSIVLDLETREVYGHIVAGSTSSRIAYIIPATNVLHDLERRQETGLHATAGVKLPSLQIGEYEESANLSMVENLAELQAATNIIGQQRASQPNPKPQRTDDPYPLPRQTTGVSFSNTAPSTLVPSFDYETLMGFDGDVDSGDEQSRQKSPILTESGKLVRPALRSVLLHRSASTPGSPARPLSKVVRFDPHIEYLQPFLQIDQPLAISAGSSPTEAHENDAELSFRDHDADGPNPSFEWEILRQNFPREIPLRMKLPVKVEKVFLSSDKRSLIGSIAVANLGADKHVVAHFTFDYWKTSLVVVAEYTHDVRQPETDEYDEFNFIVKLADYGNLETTTMFFCVKYYVDGQEYCDDNNSANFQVNFQKKAKPTKSNKGFGNRYDFGASLAAAIKAANSTLDDRNGLRMKPAEPAKPVPRIPTQATTSIHQNEPLAKDIGGEAIAPEKPALASLAYNELLDKYCFVRTCEQYQTAEYT